PSCSPVAQDVVRIARIFDLPAPRLFARTDIPGTLVAAPVLPAASLAGKSLFAFAPNERSFVLAKHLASYPRGSYLRALHPTETELTVLFLATLKIFLPSTSAPPELAADVGHTSARLRGYLEPVEVEQLRRTIKRFVAEGARTNIRQWCRAVELAAG